MTNNKIIVCDAVEKWWFMGLIVCFYCWSWRCGRSSERLEVLAWKCISVQFYFGRLMEKYCWYLISLWYNLPLSHWKGIISSCTVEVCMRFVTVFEETLMHSCFSGNTQTQHRLRGKAVEWEEPLLLLLFLSTCRLICVSGVYVADESSNPFFYLRINLPLYSGWVNNMSK